MSVPRKIYTIMKSEWEGKGSDAFFYRNVFDHKGYEKFCAKALSYPEMLNSHICWEYTSRLLEKNGINISRQAISLAYYQKSGNHEDDEDEDLDGEAEEQAELFLQHFLVALTPERVDLDKFM